MGIKNARCTKPAPPFLPPDLSRKEKRRKSPKDQLLSWCPLETPGRGKKNKGRASILEFPCVRDEGMEILADGQDKKADKGMDSKSGAAKGGAGRHAANRHSESIHGCRDGGQVCYVL